MSKTIKICPYPGLRPYNEEESIFFKGRDLHVRQIIKQLEERKIVMITGASGDGKSSLVYAGVIPNARAGFFQAEYNNWKFIDFKPERNPLKTLAVSLSQQLKTDFEQTLEKLSFGFSSLISIYKSSEFYIDKQSDGWLKATDNEQKKMRNKAANLFILADQFEEFFTNSENFSSGNASVNAYTVVNLLLETASIAIRENLPIYIVFTMRSDFISQCVAFKGLPEMIGFSQFFVPRLKRNEIKQVIEEPALLAGGKISNRLSETLINELRDGFDQLPVLQHALNQLWKLADNGNDELDLIHLAKLAGMPSQSLSANDTIAFQKWFEQLPEYHKAYFETPELSNILNSHANYLYESAFHHYTSEISWTSERITIDDAKLILKTVFLSLTKIDEGRAVRNRMTLKEITQIINKKHITYEVVNGVINIFRLPDSTFIRPFINLDDVDTQYISAGTVLDITHEALIRNWELLKEWETEELKKLEDFMEFQIQLKRWMENDKSKEFLLPQGNLIHFENWFEKYKPNPYWVVKYSNSDKDKEDQINDAEILTSNIEEYLKKSRINITQIEKAKKRRRRIVLTSALVVIAALSVLMGYAFKEKKNAERQEQLANDQRIEAQNQQKQAELERNNAIEANKRAEEEKQRAELNAKEALMAKLTSDEARKNAEKMRILAEEKSQLAEHEAKKARTEKSRADKQRQLAETASVNAHALSMLAKAQTLAFKAKQKYSDNQTNLNMAFEAYNLNKKYGGYARDANIYDGLYSALRYSNYNNIVYDSKHKIVGIQIDAGNNLLVYCSNNTLTRINASDYAVVNTLDYQNLVEAKNAFIFDNEVLVSYENAASNWVSASTNKLYALNSGLGFIKSAAVTNKYLFASSNSHIINVWSRVSGIDAPAFEIHAKSSVSKIIANDNMVFAGLKNGFIEMLDVEQRKTKTIDSLNGRISAMALSKNGMFLVAASSRGEIMFYEIGTKLSLKQIISKPGIFIDAIAISSNNKLLAIASSDKIITIYDIDNFSEKPMSITYVNNRESFQALAFNKNNQLVVVYTNNTVKVWETNNQSYAKRVKSKIKKKVSQSEFD